MNSLFADPALASQDSVAEMGHSQVRSYQHILAGALALGVLGDQLLRSPGQGVAFPVWIFVLGLSLIALSSRTGRALRGESLGWLGVALLFSAFAAWRAAGLLLAGDVMATAGALGMAAISMREGAREFLARRIRDYVQAGFLLAKSIATGLPVTLTRARPRPSARHRAWPIVRALLLSLLILVVFGSLLRGADPLFASFVQLPDLDVGTVLSHIVVIGFYAWLSAGWLRGALKADVDASNLPSVLPIRFTTLDITVALSTLIVLFGGYVLSQLGWYFGGDAYLRAHTSLTPAAYARDGFFELVFAIALVLPVLIATRAAVEPRTPIARRHTALSIPIVLLLGASMISAVARMRLYVEYFGMSTDRFYPMVFMGWLAAVLVWFVWTMLQSAPTHFIPGALVTGAIALLALNLVDPDAIVARTNVLRATTSTDKRNALDLDYLAWLDGGAVPVTVDATLSGRLALDPEQRCYTANILIERWGSASRVAERQRAPAAWRTWNRDEARAVDVVTARESELRRVEHQNCHKPHS